MVYQDYELIATKRVNRQRWNNNIMWDRRFHAFGGYSTLFTMGFVSYAAIAFDMIRTKPLVSPFTSAAGIRSIVRNASFFVAPAVLGMFIGISCAGDWNELKNLYRNAGIYNREFAAVHHELHA